MVEVQEEVQEDVLWIAARSGDARAREELAVLAAEVVSAFLRSRGVRGEEAEDLLQDAQASLLERVQSDPDPPENLRGFLKYRGYWAFGKYVRVRRRARERGGEDQLEGLAEEPEEAWKHLHGDDLRRALAFCRKRLNDRLQQICRLRYDGEFSCAEIADQLGISENAVRLRVHRAGRKLQECLRSQGVSP